MKKIVFTIKPQEGKFLRAELNIEGNLIKNCRLTGDFFIYPEESLEKLENFFQDQAMDNLEKKLTIFINKEKIKILGWTPKDFIKALLKSQVG